MEQEIVLIIQTMLVALEIPISYRDKESFNSDDFN